MNLAKLFEVQKVLRDRIGYNEPDRFDKLVLALLVEIGECANEWRGFKFWSKDQQPRTNRARHPYVDLEDAEFYNPLLEEYVDGLHFVLDLGIDLHLTDTDNWGLDHNIKSHTYNDVNYQFLWINHTATQVYAYKNPNDYEILVFEYLALGEMLGFTWEQIEQAYMDKNKVNHQRQESEY
jgi:dimeric dUTPase (all-alpha-NTP-PPase superfamily)